MKKSRATVKPFSALRAAWGYAVPEPYRDEDRVYMLDSVMGDVRFSTLQLPREAKSLRRVFDVLSKQPSRVESIVKQWKVPQATGRVSTWNDCPMAGIFPAFSARAVKCLRDLLEPHGALLPVLHEKRKYYAFAPVPRRDVFDRDRSFITNPRMSAQTIHRHVFKIEKLKMTPIFTFREDWYRTYVTNEFVQRVKDSDLLGFNFEIVFPLRPRDDFRKLAWKQLTKHRSEGLPRGQKVDGRRVRVRFLLDNPNTIPTRKQEQQVTTWANAMDALLWDPGSFAIPRGFLFHVVSETGSCDAVFEGPDAEKLVAFVGPKVGRCRWAGEVRISGRRL